MHDDTFAQVRQFQFRQDTPGKAILSIVPGDGFTEGRKQRILQSLDRKVEGQIELSIELTEAIPLTPRGKAVYVDQRIGSRTSADNADRSVPIVP